MNFGGLRDHIMRKQALKFVYQLIDTLVLNIIIVFS